MAPIPSSPSPAPSAASLPLPTLRFERCHAAALLAWGLGIMALLGGLPAAVLWSAAPEAAGAIALWTGSTAALFGACVVSERRRWLTSTVEVSGVALEIRRPHLRPERAPLAEVRRLAWGRLGLTVWLASGRELWVGRVGDAARAARLVARLESACGVPVEGWAAPEE